VWDARVQILVTGAAGFIGYHLCRRLLQDGHAVVGLDALTTYYDPRLKQARLSLLNASSNFTDVRGQLEDAALVADVLAAHSPEVVVHLAAQAGVRHSVEHPEVSLSSNVVGTGVLLEALRRKPPRHLVAASSSSVYGGNLRRPFREIDATDWPMSLYAASKKATEALTHAYASLYGMPTTCCRFFTVYGPFGRPDMALFKFVSAIEAGQPIDIYNGGHMRRDFTYIDDLVEALVRLLRAVPVCGAPVGDIDSLSAIAPWRVVNIGGGRPTTLIEFLEAIEVALGHRAQRNMLPLQMGDVEETWGSSQLLSELIDYVPTTNVTVGVHNFVEWYRGWARGN
jgi:UDP-glucuronate 4-epimerase